MKNKYIRSPLPYMGNKYRLLPQLLPLLPKNIDTFYDVFGGSGCMCGNVECKSAVYNEIRKDIYDLFVALNDYDAQLFTDIAISYVMQFKLQRIKDLKPNERFLYRQRYWNARDYYNHTKKDPVLLYVLAKYGFSQDIRFNHQGEYNTAFNGKRFMNPKDLKQIFDWKENVKTPIKFLNKDAFDILYNTDFHTGDFIYLDPPYSNTGAQYNLTCDWFIEDDLKLFNMLDQLNEMGVKWGMSNTFKNKGKINSHLIKWCEEKGYKVYHLDINYHACGSGASNNDEVYITNYNGEEE